MSPPDLHAYAVQRLTAIMGVERAQSVTTKVLRASNRSRIVTIEDLRAFADALETVGIEGARSVAIILHTRAAILRARRVLEHEA